MRRSCSRTARIGIAGLVGAVITIAGGDQGNLVALLFLLGMVGISLTAMVSVVRDSNGKNSHGKND